MKKKKVGLCACGEAEAKYLDPKHMMYHFYGSWFKDGQNDPNGYGEPWNEFSFICEAMQSVADGLVEPCGVFD